MFLSAICRPVKEVRRPEREQASHLWAVLSVIPACAARVVARGSPSSMFSAANAPLKVVSRAFGIRTYGR